MSTSDIDEVEDSSCGCVICGTLQQTPLRLIKNCRWVRRTIVEMMQKNDIWKKVKAWKEKKRGIYVDPKIIRRSIGHSDNNPKVPRDIVLFYLATILMGDVRIFRIRKEKDLEMYVYK